jgi:soluble lytic murein transglycosylase-like protein
MSNRLIVLIFWTLFAVLSTTKPTVAYDIQVIDKKRNVCGLQTVLAERVFGIPRHLLTAISLAESGQWNKSRKENIAWPWTVTSKGRGRFFKTKVEALAEIKNLMSKGEKNIDVGCMQVNLYYHGSAFKNIAEALDPKTNVSYAAGYLKKLYSTSGDWVIAMGNYHSTTPKLNKAYKARVVAYWPGNDRALKTKQNAAITYTPAPIDYQRMAKLNASFRANVESQSETKTLKATTTRQLKAWRDARIRGEGMGLFLAMRRATQRLKRKREMDQLSQTGNSQLFVERRTQQLSSWRLGETNHWDSRNSWKKPRAIRKINTGLSATSLTAAATGSEAH